MISTNQIDNATVKEVSAIFLQEKIEKNITHVEYRVFRNSVGYLD